MFKQKFGNTKLSSYTIKAIDKLLKMIILLVTVIIVLSMTNVILTKYSQEGKSLSEKYNASLSTLKAKKSELSQKESKLMNMESITSKIIDKDSFITFIGRAAEAGDSVINNLVCGETSSTNVVSSVNFKFELTGSITNISEIIKAIDSLGATYNIKKISLRKDGNYKWLSRSTGETKQSTWLEFDQTATNLNPQKIPLPESLPEVVLNDKGEIVEVKDKRLTSSEDLIDGDKITIFLDISFLIAR